MALLDWKSPESARDILERNEGRQSDNLRVTTGQKLTLLSIALLAVGRS
jgi:hypothetical protein